MNKFNIKRYLGTLAAAIAVSVASVSAQAETVGFTGTLDTVAPFGVAFGFVVGHDVSVGFDINDAAFGGAITASDISGDYATDPTATADGARFVVWGPGGVGTTPVVPILFNGTNGINSTSLTTDATTVTGGSIEFYGNAGTGQQATILVDFGAGTFDIWSGTTSFGGDTNNAFYGGGGTLSAVPVPAAAWLFGSALVGLVGVGRRRRAMA